MFEIGDIILWKDSSSPQAIRYLGLIVEDCNNGIFEVQPLSPQFIEEVERIGEETIKLRLNGFTRSEWRKIA